jgi:hypothetical protein
MNSSLTLLQHFLLSPMRRSRWQLGFRALSGARSATEAGFCWYIMGQTNFSPWWPKHHDNLSSLPTSNYHQISIEFQTASITAAGAGIPRKEILESLLLALLAPAPPPVLPLKAFLFQTICWRVSTLPFLRMRRAICVRCERKDPISCGMWLRMIEEQSLCCGVLTTLLGGSHEASISVVPCWVPAPTWCQVREDRTIMSKQPPVSPSPNIANGVAMVSNLQPQCEAETSQIITAYSGRFECTIKRAPKLREMQAKLNPSRDLFTLPLHLSDQCNTARTSARNETSPSATCDQIRCPQTYSSLPCPV